MCGISGFYNFDGAPANAAILGRMTDIQRHRGPDDQGFRLFSLKSGRSLEYAPDTPPAPTPAFEGGLGFNRLSIIDLSPRGHQPMANESQTVFLAFNGEIYNANDYRPMLESAGYSFRSRTDTEVILCLYEEFGIEGCVQRLNGMFAFVIVDLRTGEIHIARDHFGIKPMYYARAGNTLLFSSEAKGIMAWPGFRREIDPAMLDEYLLFRYNAGEGFLLRGIKQLRPGHRLRVLAGGELRIHRYHDISPAVAENITEKEAIDRFEATFEAGVKRQLISDRKLGLQLSGGIDSSLVASCARQRAGQELEAFSIVFNDEAMSERKWIDHCAKATGTISYKYPLTTDYFFTHLRRATWHYDSPINLGNAVGLYMLAEQAAKHVTVMLTGDGADELLGGYPRFFMAALRPMTRPFLSLLRNLPRIGKKIARNFDMPRGLDNVGWFIAHSTAMREWQVRDLRPDADLIAPMEGRRSIFGPASGSFIDDCTRYEMETFMVELLIRQDKMTMAHSLETRVPFLDRDTVNLARRLPTCLRVRGQIRLSGSVESGTKILLKKMAERRFGNDFTYRRKMGFGLPLGEFIRERRFQELWNDSLRPNLARRGWVDAAVADAWVRQIAGGLHGRDAAVASIWATEALWSIVSLETWAQEFLDTTAFSPGRNF